MWHTYQDRPGYSELIDQVTSAVIGVVQASGDGWIWRRMTEPLVHGIPRAYGKSASQSEARTSVTAGMWKEELPEPPSGPPSGPASVKSEFHTGLISICSLQAEATWELGSSLVIHFDKRKLSDEQLAALTHLLRDNGKHPIKLGAQTLEVRVVSYNLHEITVWMAVYRGSSV